jgi:hypothetical protein
MPESKFDADCFLISHSFSACRVVGDLSSPFEKEKEFREACNKAYGITKCKHQCIELAVSARTASVLRHDSKW